MCFTFFLDWLKREVRIASEGRGGISDVEEHQIPRLLPAQRILEV